MLRKLLAALLAVVMVLSLAACTAPAATPSVDAQEAETEKEDAAPAEEEAEAPAEEDAEAPAEEDAEATGDAKDYGGITLTFMNSKPDISDEM